MSIILPLFFTAALLPLRKCHASSIGHLEYLDAKTCPSTRHVATIYNFSTSNFNRLAAITFSFRMPRKVKSITKANLKLVQCPTNVPCKHFYTLRFAAGCCSILADRKAFWSPVFSSAEPPFLCPLESPTYKICNASIDLPIFQRLFNTLDRNLLVPAVWNTKLQAYDEHQKEFICLDLKLRYVRQDM